MFRRLSSPTGLALLTAALLFLSGREASAQLRRDGDAVSVSMPGRETVFVNVAYDPARHVYLVVNTDLVTLSAIFVDAAGRALTDPFVIHVNAVDQSSGEFFQFFAVAPHIIYSADVSDGAGGFGGFLVVWQQLSYSRAGTAPDEIRAQIVSYPNGLVGNETVIGVGFFTLLSGVVYSESSKLFLTGWTASDASSSNRFTVVRTMDREAQPVGLPKTIWPLHTFQAFAWDRSRDEFVVAYVEALADTSVVLLRIAVDGTVRHRDVVVTRTGFGAASPLGASPFCFSALDCVRFPSGSRLVSDIDISFSPRTGNHIVVWQESGAGSNPRSNPHLYTAEIDSAGAVVATRQVASQIGWPSIAYSAPSGTFAVVGGCTPEEPISFVPPFPQTPLICAIELNDRGELTSGVVTGSLMARLFSASDRVQVASRPDVGGWLASSPRFLADSNPFVQAFQTSAVCLPPDPFATLGGGVCMNGGWLPFGHPGIGEGVGTPPPSSPPPPPPTGCSGSDPFVSLGGGVCVNGGWLPPGFPGTGGTTPPPSSPPGPAPSGCSGSDPFASLPTLIGRCVDGGWIPVPGIKTAGTVRFFAIGSGVWVIEGADGALYEPTDGLSPAFQTASLSVFVEAELIPTATPTLPEAVVISIHTLAIHLPSW